MTGSEEHALRVRAKQAIRERMRGLRRVLPTTARATRSEALCARVLELPEVNAARTLVGYHALKTEADPDLVLRALRARGVRIGLPRVIEGGGLSLLEWSEHDALERNALGILEPKPSAAEIASAEVDVILVPALAFDVRGHRVGYGQGYYDRLLTRLPAAFAVGLGFDFQLLFELPNTSDDVQLSAVVTDAQALYVSK